MKPHYPIAAMAPFAAFVACLALSTGCSPAINTEQSPQSQISTPDNAADNQSTQQTPEQQAYSDALTKRFSFERADYEQQLTPYKQTVPLGSTFPLANLDNAPITITTYEGVKIETNVHSFVSWDGTINAAVLDATLYPSIGFAQKTNNLGAILDPPPQSLEDPQLLVMHIEVSNIDAVSTGTSEYFPIGTFKPMYPYANEAAGSYMDYVSASLATFDGAPEGIDQASPYANDFALPVGDTRVLTAGWWVPGDIDPSLIIIRPSLSASNPGPIFFDLNLENSK